RAVDRRIGHARHAVSEVHFTFMLLADEQERAHQSYLRRRGGPIARQLRGVDDGPEGEDEKNGEDREPHKAAMHTAQQQKRRVEERRYGDLCAFGERIGTTAQPGCRARRRLTLVAVDAALAAAATGHAFPEGER